MVKIRVRTTIRVLTVSIRVRIRVLCTAYFRVKMNASARGMVRARGIDGAGGRDSYRSRIPWGEMSPATLSKTSSFC